MKELAELRDNTGTGRVPELLFLDDVMRSACSQGDALRRAGRQVLRERDCQYALRDRYGSEQLGVPAKSSCAAPLIVASEEETSRGWTVH